MISLIFQDASLDFTVSATLLLKNCAAPGPISCCVKYKLNKSCTESGMIPVKAFFVVQVDNLKQNKYFYIMNYDKK